MGTSTGTPGRHRPVGSGRLRIGLPFLAVHLSVLAVVLVGWSVTAVVVATVLYVVRALAITVVYHRGLAHRSFRMPRAVQAVGSLVATAAAQRGPLWWVAHHRTHHRRTDTEGDPHSPVAAGFWWSHLLWLFDERTQATDRAAVPDLASFPELCLLDRWHHVVTAAAVAATFGAGAALHILAPGLGVTGLQLLVWGFCISTVALWHSTFAVNSFAHRFGRRRFATSDGSRNLWWVAVLTLGEGWHNNHHRFPRSARQGLSWRELDPSWWVIRAMASLGLASELRVVTAGRVAAAAGQVPAQWRSRRASSTAPASVVASGPDQPTPRRAA
jgi:stearoyl-CoA desaturase (Delta-9 desaturase)